MRHCHQPDRTIPAVADVEQEDAADRLVGKRSDPVACSTESLDMNSIGIADDCHTVRVAPQGSANTASSCSGSRISTGRSARPSDSTRLPR
jgi:hypothetical protein